MRIRVRPALALAALLVSAACSEGGIDIGSGSDPESERSTDTLILEPPDGETPGGSPSGDGTAPPSPAPDGSDAAPGGGSPDSDGSGSSDGGGSGGSDTGGPGTGGHDLSVNDRGAVGSMGPALLRPEVPEVVVEIDATPGESMTTQARNALADQVDEHGNKESVGFVEGSTLPEQEEYTVTDLRSLMETHRAVWSTRDRAAVYVMVLSGLRRDDPNTPNDESQTVGVAFNASAYAIFPDQLSGGLLGLNYANFEEAVVVHELGHLYGLVNLTGHGAFHEAYCDTDPPIDPDSHCGHSENEDSVMFWAVESTVAEDVFEGGPPRDFDADDEEEMRRIRSAG